MSSLTTRVISMAGWPLFIIFMALTLLAPVIQSTLFPIRVDQKVQVIERTDKRICWAWTATKIRSGFSIRIDVRVDSPLVDGANGTIYTMHEGNPWGIHAATVPADGMPHTFDWCADLPPYAASGPVRVRQTAYYPGALGWLWSVPSRFPDVVDPPTATFPE